MRKINIQTKIVLPFTLLFALVIAVSTSITITLTYKQVDARIEDEMNRLANALSLTGSALNSDFLANVKRAVGVEISVYDKDLKTVASTISDYEPLESQIRSSFLVQSTPIRDEISKIEYQGKPYQAMVRQVQIKDPDSKQMILLMMPTSDIAATKKRVTISMLLIALLAIALAGGVGHLIAKSITAPIKDLLDLTKRVSGGDLEYEGTVKSQDEIGELAKAFNQMTKQLKLFQNQLVESERLAMAGQMAAAFAHDMRNPLSSIKMIVQLLKKRIKLTDDNEKYIQAILDEINRMDATIKGRLDLIRPVELNLRDTNLNRLLLDLIGLMEANMAHHNIELEKFLDASAPDLKLDADRVKQAFMNIILNSIQAMPNGGRLAISSELDPDGVSVEISDTGTGMSDETFSQLFKPFYTTKEGGTGLGLLNAKRAVEQHGGSLEIHSELGAGTKVRVRFPLPPKAERRRTKGEVGANPPWLPT